MSWNEIFLIALTTSIFMGIIFWRVHNNIAIRRSQEMQFLRITIARKDSDLDEKKDTVKDFREQISIMEQLFAGLKSLYGNSFSTWLFGQEYISFEYVADKGEIFFYVVVSGRSRRLVEKQIIALYPDSLIEAVPQINICTGRKVVVAEELQLKKAQQFPIRTYQKLESDSMNGILSALGRLGEDTSATIQVLLRPIADTWQEKIKHILRKSEKKTQKKHYISFNPLSWISHFFELFLHVPKENEPKTEETTDEAPIDEEGLMKEKVKKTGWETSIRIIVTTDTRENAEVEMKNILSGFSQFSSPLYNRFHASKHSFSARLLASYNHRRFIFWEKKMLLNIEELATIYHFPHSRYNKQPEIRWQYFKFVKAPVNVATEGLYLGDNVFRGERKKIYISTEDRFRHFYVIGQTGTGKSSILTIMARQDIQNNQGLAILDPHGDFANGLLDFIPKNRADDLIYFDPGDLSRPMGLNMLEASSEDEKQAVVADTTDIMIKLYGNAVFGPRLQDYFRNGCLTLMDYPSGGALTDIVRLFTDEPFQQERRNTIQNPMVKTWWDYTYAKMGEREKGEIIPYFAAKFGAFITNTLMRNIIGQTKSSFDVTDIMNNQKILLASLSKGTLGDLNSSLLGLILVSKIQIASMKRQKMPIEQRKDFFLYVDEFQNYITDSIESILSEARKYRLGLVVAHQYMAQLQKSDALTESNINLKDAIFGNVGSMMSYKIGPEDAEIMAKQFAPVYSEQDFMNMDAFKAALRLSIKGQPSSGFSLEVPFPWLEKGDPVIGSTLKELSRLKYARDREFVEKEILHRIG